MFNSPVDEIKNRLDIIEVISSYIKLQKTGANFRALCPFHSEKKPSFFVSPARQIWHCFGCSEGGDIFKFVMKIEGVEFGDALRILAKKAGVELKPQTPEAASWQTERQRLYEICEWATRFFERQLSGSSVGKEAKKYLLKRGISEDSIKKWRLGYSPDTWQGLTDFLVGKGYQKEEIERAGLAIKNEQGGFYDRFRGRIIFPIFDLNSQVVGFGGRIFKEKDKADIAKYINTPNTLLYDKSRILYGLDKAKVEIRKKDACILVEGYIDVIMAHQVGTQNVVATSGTALTSYQLKVIKRYSENLILGFDMDVAGDTATKRGINLAQSLGFNIKVTRLPEGKDAADIILKNPKEWHKTLQNSKLILEFYFQSAFSRRDSKTLEGKKEISKILLPVLKRIPNQIEKSFWIQKLAEELEVKEESIEEELKKVKIEEEVYGLEPEDYNSSTVQQRIPPKSRKELLEEKLVTLILKTPKNLNFIDKNKLTYFSPQIQEILIKLDKNQKIDSDFFNYLALKAEVEEIEEKEILPEIQFCLKEIQSLEIKNRLDQISKDLKKAESEKNSQKIEKLTQEFNQLVKNII
ncbi:MAG: DNA primase [Patescibacteria group bacterium]|nr:DNA primase [Patescibacteria group bacterium]